MVRFRLAFPSAGVLKSSGSGNGGWRNLLRCCSSHENRREDEERSIYGENLGISHRLSEFQSLTAVCLNFGQTAFSVDTRGVASLLYCQHKEQISFPQNWKQQSVNYPDGFMDASLSGRKSISGDG